MKSLFVLVAFLLLLLSPEIALSQQGDQLVGKLRNRSRYGVGGTVYIRDEKTFVIKVGVLDVIFSLFHERKTNGPFAHNVVVFKKSLFNIYFC